MNPIGSFNTSTFDLPIAQRILSNGVGGEVKTQPTESSEPSGFAGMLSEGIGKVNSMQKDADSQVHELLTGGEVSQVEVLTAVQKADMAFRLLVQVRNKLLAAYEEINAIRV